MRKENPRLISIVEGQGDVRAVPVLLRRILGERHGRYDVFVPEPVRTRGGGDIIRNLENRLQQAWLRGCDAILVLVDTDGDTCPADLATRLSERADGRNLNVPISIVCPNSEYETWFIASLSEDTGLGIRRRLGIDDSITAPDDVENIRGAKEWLSESMSDGRYRETRDQENLTPHIDLNLVHARSRSFRRLCHAVEELLHALDGGVAPVTPPPAGTSP